MKLLIASFLLLSAPLVQAATCRPTNDTQRWMEGSVNILQGASQRIYQVRATGVYLTADLICSLGQCVGFVGGVVVANGTLQFSKSGPSEPVGFSIETPAGNGVPSATFICD